jgi:hypothetical protein
VAEGRVIRAQSAAAAVSLNRHRQGRGAGLFSAPDMENT